MVRFLRHSRRIIDASFGFPRGLTTHIFGFQPVAGFRFVSVPYPPGLAMPPRFGLSTFFRNRQFSARCDLLVRCRRAGREKSAKICFIPEIIACSGGGKPVLVTWIETAFGRLSYFCWRLLEALIKRAAVVKIIYDCVDNIF